MSHSPLDHIAAAHKRVFGTSGAAAGGNPALREQLIDAAERLLAERQVSAITTRDIARAAGLSVGVLYNYFADKNDLVLAALLRRYDAQVAAFSENLPTAGEGDVEANLTTLAQALFTLASGSIPAVAGLMSEPELLHRFLTEIHGPEYGIQRTLGNVGDYLAAEQSRGRLGAFDVSAAVTALVGSMIALGTQAMVGGSQGSDAPSQIPAIVRTLVTGLGA